MILSYDKYHHNSLIANDYMWKHVCCVEWRDSKNNPLQLDYLANADIQNRGTAFTLYLWNHKRIAELFILYKRRHIYGWEYTTIWVVPTIDADFLLLLEVLDVNSAEMESYLRIDLICWLNVKRQGETFKCSGSIYGNIMVNTGLQFCQVNVQGMLIN